MASLPRPVSIQPFFFKILTTSSWLMAATSCLMSIFYTPLPGCQALFMRTDENTLLGNGGGVVCGYEAGGLRTGHG